MARTTFFSKGLSVAGFYVGGAIYHEALRPRSLLDAFYTRNYLRDYYEGEQYDELMKALLMIGAFASLTGFVAARSSPLSTGGSRQFLNSPAYQG